jgi:SagB-type dehydrogenase family enzyme
MAEHLAPYVTVHAALPGGVFKYDWKGHKLIEVSKDDIRGSVASQSFAARAPVILIFSSDPAELGNLRGQDSAEEFACVLTGAMTQDVYLAAAALNLGARYIHSMKAENIVSALRLPEGARPIALMLIGK